MKKIFQFFALFCTVVCMGVSVGCNKIGNTSKNFTVKSGVLVGIQGKAFEAEDLEVPLEVEGTAVSGLGEKAFCQSYLDNELLKSVSISANITSIDSRAFHNCPNLEEIKVASDNEYFQSIDGVLYSKDGKSLIRYPNGKNGNSFTIPNQVKKICDGAFNGYGLELKEVVLPNEIEYIGNSGLATMGGLDNGRVTMMLNCTEKDGGYYLGSVENPYLAFAGVVSRKIDSVSIHTDTKFILSWAFNLSEVKSVKIPNGVVQLGAESFSYCARLNSVSLPLSLKNIGKDAFFQCTALKSVSFTIAKNWYVDDLLMAEAELQDVATAAKYLSTTYCGNEWERKIIIAEDEN